jgi:5-methylcytosine-specific restriction endonuclease McrA
MSHCILLNADYSFLNLVNWKRAVCLLAKGKVEVVKDSPATVHSCGGRVHRLPAVLRLIKLIRTIYRAGVAFSKRNVFVRDGFRCAYCGDRRDRLSIDHIIPRSRGGRTSFENCVAACKTCNLKKGGRTPSEAGMFLRTKAYQPTISEFLRLKFQNRGLQELLSEIGF